MDLKDRWNRLCETFKPVGLENIGGKYFWPYIESKYSEKHRYYHTLNHIEHCFNELDSVENDLDLGFILTKSERFIIEPAIWFHDIEYDLHSLDNEEASAHRLGDICRMLYISSDYIDMAKRFILKTKHSNVVEINSHLCNLFLDIDLSILGQNEDVYNQYSNDIRKEYDWVPLEMYKTKRVEILSNIINSAGIDKSIYKTEFFHHKYEKQARKNILKEIKSLV